MNIELQNKTNEYTLLISEVNKVEKELEYELKGLIRKEKVEQYRNFDYSRRFFSLIIPFDQINIFFFSEENVKKLKELWIKYDNLRKQQKHIETEIQVLNSPKKVMKETLLGGSSGS